MKGAHFMKNDEYWKQFEKTGDVLDYLNYTACTCEETMLYTSLAINESKEGDYYADINYGDRNGFVGHADR